MCSADIGAGRVPVPAAAAPARRAATVLPAARPSAARLQGKGHVDTHAHARARTRTRTDSESGDSVDDEARQTVAHARRSVDCDAVSHCRCLSRWQHARPDSVTRDARDALLLQIGSAAAQSELVGHIELGNVSMSAAKCPALTLPTLTYVEAGSLSS